MLLFPRFFAEQKIGETPQPLCAFCCAKWAKRVPKNNIYPCLCPHKQSQFLTIEQTQIEQKITPKGQKTAELLVF
jgi:hypothetical protein